MTQRRKRPARWEAENFRQLSLANKRTDTVARQADEEQEVGE